MQTRAMQRQSAGGAQRRSGESAELRAPRSETPHGDQKVASVARRAMGLGWFSVGLGMTQILAPGLLARMIGVRDSRRTRKTMVALGVREISAGVGILMLPRTSTWLWARFAGDLMDLALLGGALGAGRNDRVSVAAATAAVIGCAALDAKSAVDVSRDDSAAERYAKRPLQLSASITVNRSVDEVYRLWRDFSNLPKFMQFVESVEAHNGKTRWRMKSPMGVLSWDAEIVTDRPNEEIAWRSVAGAELKTQGRVHFRAAPGSRGTEITLELKSEPPGGMLGATITRLFGPVPEVQLERDLRRFKQLIETGEVMRSDASIHAGPHPAQPPKLAPQSPKGVLS